MPKNRDFSGKYFWLLLLISLIFLGLGLTSLHWIYRQDWAQNLWHICQSGLQNLGQHSTLTWQLSFTVIILVIIARGSWSFGQQLWRTQRFVRYFFPFRAPLPARVLHLAEQHHLTPENLVYLKLTTCRAFCLGFWRPRIWLTEGLVNLLTDEELSAVLIHEAHHCRQRDPLRLLISRTLKAAFFFLPLVSKLSGSVELEQEVAADQAAISSLGDDLPLLCALQKLIVAHQARPVTFPGAALSLFNLSEARLRRLIYPTESPPFRRKNQLAGWAINLGVIMILSSIGFLSTQPITEHGEIGTCPVDQITLPLQTQLPLSD